MQPIGIRENDCCFTSVIIWVENKQIKLFHISHWLYIYIHTHSTYIIYFIHTNYLYIIDTYIHTYIYIYIYMYIYVYIHTYTSII